MTSTLDTRRPILYDYDTGKEIRIATDAELAESIAAEPSGVITIDGRDCYVRE